MCAQLIRLSRLYESAAAYVTDQPAFLNAAALVETPLGPRALLTALKAIEVRNRGSPAVETPIAQSICAGVGAHRLGPPLRRPPWGASSAGSALARARSTWTSCS
jgi:hypothetical protein